VFAFGIVLLTLLFWLWPPSPEPLGLRFLYYTNNAMRDRIAVMEITNRSDSPYRWSLRSETEGVNHDVLITDLVETNGELRGVGMGGGINLFEHDALQFGTDDFQRGKRLWVVIQHYPATRGERGLEKLSFWLERCGLRRFAPDVRETRRIYGPVLPPDRP
jgi:hypothetical protein